MSLRIAGPSPFTAPLTVSIRPNEDGGLRSALGGTQCLAERILKRLD